MQLNQKQTTLEDLERLPWDTIVTWARYSCWWGLLTDCDTNSSGRPCDPQGSVVFEGDLGDFLDTAKDNPSHYGRHELKAFMAAYHGNVMTPSGKPTSLNTWEEYNSLLDKEV